MCSRRAISTTIRLATDADTVKFPARVENKARAFHQYSGLSGGMTNFISKTAGTLLTTLDRTSVNAANVPTPPPAEKGRRSKRRAANPLLSTPATTMNRPQKITNRLKSTLAYTLLGLTRLVTSSAAPPRLATSARSYPNI